MSGELSPSSPEHVLKEFEGTYLGFGPTDESALGFGEISITISGQGIRTRWATGLEIQEENDTIDKVIELSAQEVTGLFPEGEEAPNTRAFDVDGLTYMFIPCEEPEVPVLWITGSMGDLLGPTALFTPEQVEQGIHETALKQMEEAEGAPGAIPRLYNNGRAPRED